MIKTGIQSNAYLTEDIDGGFAKLKSHGYDCADYRMENPNLPLYALTETEYERYLTGVGLSAKKNGVEIFQTHGLWPTDDTTASNRRKKIETYKKQIRGNAYLGCKNMVVHPCMPFGWFGNKEDYEQIFAMNAEELTALAPYAKEYGVTLCLENMPGGITNGAFVNEVVKTINDDFIKICFDTGHAHTQKEDFYQTLKAMGEDLRVLHVHDNNGKNDLHAIPFQYTLDWEAFVCGLNSVGYGGCMSLETFVPNKTPQPMREQMQKALFGICKYLAGRIEG